MHEPCPTDGYLCPLSPFHLTNLFLFLLLLQKKKGVQLDQESRAWQRKHYLDSLERDNFVARTEFEAIIATAEATAAVPGLANLNTTTFDVVQSAVGAAIGGGSSMAGVGLGQASTTASTVGGEQSLPHVGKRARTGGRGRSTSGGGSGTEAAKYSARRGGNGRGIKLPPTKPLNTLIQESGIASQNPEEPSYLTSEMGPSRYPARRLCSVCGWRGLYCCTRCGMRYCGLQCLNLHQDTRYGVLLYFTHKAFVLCHTLFLSSYFYELKD
jgi:zinc finger HIT domain-containing protein 1